MTTLDNYLGIVKQEIVSHKVSIRQDAHVDYETLEHLMKDAARVIGEDKFVENVVDPLMDLTPYVKTQFKTAVSVMRYFTHLDDERKKALAIQASRVIKEKLHIAENNRKIDPAYQLHKDAFNDSMFAAYMQVRNEFKMPSQAEIKALKGFLEGE